ncbi:MAG: zinc-ribbon domain-containing protein [Acidobacteriota bacterium]
MAITRCPYCHAIIDENDKYCNNCGTQLLFADDDDVEEEIPGEKIVEAEVEEKDYTVEEPEGEKRPTGDRDLEDDIEEELEEKTEEMRPEDLVDEEGEEGEEDEESEPTEEVILVDENDAAAGKAGIAAAPEEDKTGEVKAPSVSAAPQEGAESLEEDEEDEEHGKGTMPIALDDEIEDELEEEEEELEPPPPSGERPEIEYVAETPPPDEAATAGEAALRPVTFDTKEFENLGRTVELSKQKVDRFIEGRAVAAPPAAPPEPPSGRPEAEPIPEPRSMPWAEPMAQAEPGREEEGPAREEADAGEGALAGTPEPSTGALPPWASTMKGAPVFTEDTGPVETRRQRGGEPFSPDTEEGVEIFPRRRASDSTIGLPEQVRQAPLPFEAAVAGEDADMEDEELADEERDEREEEEAALEIPRDLTPEEVVLPAGQVSPIREPVLPARPREAAGPAFEAAEEAEEPEPRPPFSFSVFFKSKAFDILFVGLFWLVALWLAAGSTGRTLFEILGAMSGPMLLLYGVFLLIYFFLFKFFLGETIGDRLFRRRE